MLPYSKESQEVSRPFSHQISITAVTGAGSSSLMASIKTWHKFKNKPYRFVSAGGLMRDRADSKLMAIEEFTAHCRAHPEEGHDSWLDLTIARLAHHNWVVCEGRLPHVFMPKAFKILLKCDLNLRAERRARDLKISTEKALEKISARDADDHARYEALYPGCHWADSDFDLCLDSTKMGTYALTQEIEYAHERWQEKKSERGRLNYGVV